MKQPLVTIVVLLFTISTKAQFSDSLQIRVGTNVTTASQDYQPLWLGANKFGTITDRKTDASTFIRLMNKHEWNEDFYINYGASLYNNNHFKDVLLEEAYLKAGWRMLEFRAGRYEEVIGEMDRTLSSGSLGVSGNAVPIPKLSIAIGQYLDIPFTKGLLQFKGQFSHGWMGRDQYIKDAYLHEKNFYMRIGKNRLKVWGGVQHYAVWGGNRPDLPTIKSSFKDYLNVVIVKQGDDGTVNSDSILPNRPGDHRGVVEGGIDWEDEQMLVRLYNQTPFETGQGIDIRNIDRLIGVMYVNKNEGSILKRLTAEFMHTKQMNDFYPLNVRESYYNNGIYLTGWEYQSRIVGTPLFINRTRGSKYFENVTPFDWNDHKDDISGKGWNIINNRIVGFHLAGAYAFGDNISAQTKISFTKNYGTYNNQLLSPTMTQWYTLQEVTYQTPVEGLSVNASAAFDFGEITDNAGFMLGVQWLIRAGR
ncbi:capsule assembly Wzi family protein [Chitinophaga horti]|uniref:Capsule assembly Wzi family protein n=1 Tax=Chitinophaga horti TaxID=2920382 RepID=A0ABY6IYN8_9BACT|nr:capsule assembly Wzi family protein [Chitinophaga horti]UYQ92368.1 capsule assembly Wzi family protein [Chitinophaga horti]